jgi:hypothetical protein
MGNGDVRLLIFCLSGFVIMFGSGRLRNCSKELRRWLQMPAL